MLYLKPKQDQTESGAEPAGSESGYTLDGHLSKHTLGLSSVYTQIHSGSDYGTPTPLPGLAWEGGGVFPPTPAVFL